MNIFVINGGYADMHWIEGAVLTHNIDEADVILFTGGEDVTPSIYNEECGKYTGPCNLERDTRELAYFDMYVNVPKIGICRGSQFLCAASGGKLVQHVKHPNYHSITNIDGKVLQVNSTHHQMMFPFNVNHVLLGWSQISDFHLGGDDKEMEDMTMLNGKPIEAEVVWFPETKSLCIQSHPEYDGYPEKTGEWLNKLINTYVKSNKLQEEAV